MIFIKQNCMSAQKCKLANTEVLINPKNINYDKKYK